MTIMTVPSRQEHRIGAVSSISGVPVPTLRVWEARYGAFQPRVSGGGHRQYTDDDVLRATLLRRLTAHGHAISSIAQLDAGQLNALLSQHSIEKAPAPGGVGTGQSVQVAVVGLAMAAQLSGLKFKHSFLPHQLQLSGISQDLEAALRSAAPAQPHVLVVQVNSLHALVQAALQRLIQETGAVQVIVCYRFGPEAVAQSLQQAGMVLRRGPLSDFELSDLLRSVLRVAPDVPQRQLAVSAAIPPRKYDDTTLARMASISTNVLCECPRHVSELISQLVSFEEYSRECLNKNPEDAHLHAYLRSVSGSARALFEQALEKVALHEGLDLGGTEALPLVE